MHLCTNKIHGRYHFTWYKIFQSLGRDSPCSIYPENPSSSMLFSFLTAHILMLSVSWEKTSSRRGLLQAMALHESLRMKHAILKNAIMSFWGGTECYFSSLDNKINRWVPTGDIRLWQPKATVVVVCHKRPPHSLIVFTVRWFVLICSLKFFPQNFTVVSTSCSHK